MRPARADRSGTVPDLLTLCREPPVGVPSYSMMLRSLQSGLVLAFVAVVTLVAAEEAAQACKLAVPRPLVLDPQSSDTTPPSAPTATVGSIRRGKGPETNGCSQSASSCDDLGSIDIALTATDDQATLDTMGFQVEVTEGNPPQTMTLPTGPVLATAGHLYLAWVDGATDEQESIAFAVAIRAVDLAGNLSPPTTVKVTSESSGCSVAGGLRSSWATTVALLLLVTFCLRRTMETALLRLGRLRQPR